MSAVAAYMRSAEDRIFTPGRLALCGAALITLHAIALGQAVAHGGWLFRPDGAVINTDLVQTWAAGRLAIYGRAADAYDPVLITAEQYTVGYGLPAAYGWPYPPTFLLVAALLGLLPYFSAFVVWMTATLVIYLLATYAIVPHRVTTVLALASPVAFVNVILGQNGFLTAALVGGVLVFLDKRPAIAGVILGLLTYKPQFGLLFPLVVIITGRWRVLVAAMLTMLTITAISYFAFGAAPWEHFARTLLVAGNVIFTHWTSPWALQSVYSLVRWVGGSAVLAWSVHAGVALIATALVCWIWLKPIDYSLKASSLSSAALVVTPYLIIYDLTALAVPIAFLIRAAMSSQFLPGERTALMGGGVVLVAFGSGSIPIGPLVLALVIGLVVAHVAWVKS